MNNLSELPISALSEPWRMFGIMSEFIPAF